MHSVAPVTGRQFASFRVIFGLYLVIHFAHLVPWGAELFSREGVLPAANLNPTYGIFPNVLAVWDSPQFVIVFLLALVVLSVLFCLGIWRRAAALLIWYGWACLFNRNVLIANPSIPYVGMLLLLTTLVPVTEPLRPFSRESPREVFYVPGAAYWTAWGLMAAGYAFSGCVKLASPSWIDGTAIWHVLQNPLARDTGLRDLLLSMPPWVFKLITWQTLALELLFLPLALWRRTRPVVWVALAALHIGIVALLDFADLSAGMLMLHLFTLDSRWSGDQMVRSRGITAGAEVLMTSKRIVGGALALVVGVCVAVGAAQQQTTATRREAQFENEHVQVWKSIIMPDQPLALHRHDFGRTIVVLKGGALDIVNEKRETVKTLKWETGKAYWLDKDPAGEQHGDLNRGTEPIEVIVVQMKR